MIKEAIVKGLIDEDEEKGSEKKMKWQLLKV